MSTLSNQNFGLVIAHLLPGFVALWGVSYFSPTVEGWIAAIVWERQLLKRGRRHQRSLRGHDGDAGAGFSIERAFGLVDDMHLFDANHLRRPAGGGGIGHAEEGTIAAEPEYSRRLSPVVALKNFHVFQGECHGDAGGRSLAEQYGERLQPADLAEVGEKYPSSPRGVGAGLQQVAGDQVEENPVERRQQVLGGEGVGQ